MKITANGIAIEVNVKGSRNDPVILLTRGLGTQLTDWSETFCQGLVDDGYQVVRYDNRDCGLSQKMGPCETDNIIPKPCYDIYDMAADSIGVLDFLEIARAHIFGVSMGGMISQVIAARYPERTASLISVMSSYGEQDPTEGGSKAAVKGLLDPWPPASARDEIIAKGIGDGHLFGSQTHRLGDDVLRDAVIASMERCYCPGGILRQYAAVLNSSDRQDMLRTISCPSLIIHGDEDPLIPAASGRRAAQLIPNATFHLIKGMGHDMPAPLLPELIACVHAHCQKAEQNPQET